LRFERGGGWEWWDEAGLRSGVDDQDDVVAVDVAEGVFYRTAVTCLAERGRGVFHGEGGRGDATVEGAVGEVGPGFVVEGVAVRGDLPLVGGHGKGFHLDGELGGFVFVAGDVDGRGLLGDRGGALDGEHGGGGGDGAGGVGHDAVVVGVAE